MLLHIGTTYSIGPNTSFPEFALRCATMFMRNVSVVQGGPFGVKIPPAKVHYNYGRKIAAARGVLNRLRGMTRKEQLAWAARKSAQVFREEKLLHSKTMAEEAVLFKKFDEILRHAKAWKPPTKKHSALKKVMIEQLTICLADFSSNSELDSAPFRRDPANFLMAEKKRLKSELLSWSKHLKSAEAGAKARNEWVNSLTKSLSV